MALRLGLSQEYMSDIFARQMTGVIPDRKWKEKNIGVRWVHGDTVISGIGQGFILTNCMQLAVMMARVASNREVSPRLIKVDAKPTFPELGLQKKNIEYVFRGLEEVTRPGGTAAGSAINVGGKKWGQDRNIPGAQHFKSRAFIRCSDERAAKLEHAKPRAVCGICTHGQAKVCSLHRNRT